MRVIAVALLITGCTAVPYANEQGGTIDHNVPQDESYLLELANKECERYGKKAVLTEERSASWARPGGTNFRCVEP